MTKQVRTVQFKTSEKTVEIPQALAQTLRGVSISARHQPIVHAVAKGIDEDIPVVFDEEAKRAVLRIIYVVMQTGSNERHSSCSSSGMRCGPISRKADAAAAADMRGRGSKRPLKSQNRRKSSCSGEAGPDFRR